MSAPSLSNLLVLAQRAIESEYSDAITNGVTIPQQGVMAAIDADVRTISAIADRMGLVRQTVAIMADRMVDKGLLAWDAAAPPTGKPGMAPARLAFTPKGLEAFRVSSRVLARVEAALLGDLKPADTLTFRRTLAKIQVGADA